MTAAIALTKMQAAANKADILEVKLTIARRNGAPARWIEELQAQFTRASENVMQLWDEWNDAMLTERLARI